MHAFAGLIEPVVKTATEKTTVGFPKRSERHYHLEILAFVALPYISQLVVIGSEPPRRFCGESFKEQLQCSAVL